MRSLATSTGRVGGTRYAYLLVAILFSSHCLGETRTVAHRGLACGMDENSLASIERAWRAGADAVEVDVRVLADESVVLFHDDRIGNSSVNAMSIDELSLAAGRPIATLEHAMESAATRHLILDLKSSQPDHLAQIAIVIDASALPATSLTVQSDDPAALAWLAEEAPAVRRFYLSRLKRKFPYLRPPSAESVRRAVSGIGVHGFSIKGRRFIDKEYLSRLRSDGQEVYVWTINEPRRAGRFANLGVDAVITDKVPLVLASLHNEPAAKSPCPHW